MHQILKIYLINKALWKYQILIDKGNINIKVLFKIKHENIKK